MTQKILEMKHVLNKRKQADIGKAKMDEFNRRMSQLRQTPVIKDLSNEKGGLQRRFSFTNPHPNVPHKCDDLTHDYREHYEEKQKKKKEDASLSKQQKLDKFLDSLQEK